MKKEADAIREKLFDLLEGLEDEKLYYFYIYIIEYLKD